MSDNNDIIESLKKAIPDTRCAAVRISLQELLHRVDPVGEKAPRVLDKTGKVLEAVDDIVGAISLDETEIRRMRHTNSTIVNGDMGFKVTLKNVFVNIVRKLAGNEHLTIDYMLPTDGLYNVSFVMTYLIDNDKEIPLKPVYVQLEAVTKEVEDEVMKLWK